MLGRTPEIFIKTVKRWSYCRFYSYREMIKHFIKKVRGSSFANPRILICVNGSTPVERKAIQDSALQQVLEEFNLLGTNSSCNWCQSPNI